ncbi:virulence factor [Maritalea sp.]|uniref:virulence factor n=1 Tax=Maritalea sp. TaxID=2003361 RepID=UPI003EF32A25
MSITIIYWRDIPTQVTHGRGRKGLKRPLADRFLVAVDKAAMESGADDTDSYLAEWRREAIEIGDEAPADALERIASSLEEQFPTKVLAEIARNGGNKV